MAVATTARPPPCVWRVGVLAWALAAVTGLAAIDTAVAADEAPNTGFPQTWVGIPKPSPTPAHTRDPNAQMLVKADELNYDYTNSRVLAVGNVQIYYDGSRLEADKVVYDQKTKRLRAEGNVWLRESDGKVVNGNVLDLNDQFRDGFVDSLRLESADKTRFAAPRANRATDQITVFESGIYTACEPCADDPKKPPKWQVKATRIIHDEVEKMIYFENARLEVFGIPLFWAPYMSAPDPTVKRKSGLLPPLITTSSNYGVAFTQPYFWALAPNYDLTFRPVITSNQGLLGQAEWRHRLVNGSYSVDAAGIYQLDTNQVQFSARCTILGQILCCRRETTFTSKYIWPGWKNRR